MRRFFVLIASAGILLGLVKPARAQSALEVTDVQVKYSFGEEITFTARLQADSAIQSARLFFQPEGEPDTRSLPLTLAADGRAAAQYLIPDNLVRPFSRITFWYQVSLASGSQVKSPRYFFTYADNRFAWQTSQDASLVIHWHTGDPAFGQAALAAAQAGLSAFQALLPVSLTAPIDVYIYPSAAEVQAALNLGGTAWISGQASPDLGVVLVSVAPGEDQDVQLNRQIPHELAHVLLYRSAGPAYNSLPTWLREGLAGLAEQSQNPDDAQVLAGASRNDALLPLADLCGLFPQDASGASLAYAESDSFVRYLYTTYGASGLHAFLQAYAEDPTCEQGTQRAVGVPLSQLDLHWQQAVLGKKAGSDVFQNLLPFAAILLFIVAGPVVYFVMSGRRKEAHVDPKSE